MTRVLVPIHEPPCPGIEAHVDHWGRPSCIAHRRALNPAYSNPGDPETKGMPCRKARVPGLEVCDMHGGGSPANQRAAKKRVTEKRAEAYLAKIGMPKPVQISHTEALIWLVSAKYAEVLWLREKVAGFAEEDLVWGVTSETIKMTKGEEDLIWGPDVTETSKVYGAEVNTWWKMLRTAEDQLVKFATAAHAAGVDDAMVSMAKARGLLLGRFLDSLMDDLRDALIAAGVTTEAFPAAWSGAISTLFPAAFRALGQSEGGS